MKTEIDAKDLENLMGIASAFLSHFNISQLNSGAENQGLALIDEIDRLRNKYFSPEQKVKNAIFELIDKIQSSYDEDDQGYFALSDLKYEIDQKFKMPT